LSALQIIFRIPGFLLAISIHEYAHARTAFRLGDDTAERAGRMTLEPWAHIDIVGALMLLVFGFGWAHPVPIDPYRMKNPRKDMAKVALAGPLANFLAFVVLQIGVVLLASTVHFSGTRWLYIPNLLQETAFVNATMGAFNLIPIPPLDGSRILEVFLPPSMSGVWDTVERYGFMILVLLIVTNVIPVLLSPVLNLLTRVTQGLAGAISLLLFPSRLP
jgi:Zn-dependent protease